MIFGVYTLECCQQHLGVCKSVLKGILEGFRFSLGLKFYDCRSSITRWNFNTNGLPFNLVYPFTGHGLLGVDKAPQEYKRPSNDKVHYTFGKWEVNCVE